MQPAELESTGYFAQSQFAAWVRRRSDEYRYELLNGRIVMTPPAGYPHGRREASVVAALHAFVASQRLGIVCGSSQGFELPSGDTVEADATYVSNERWAAGPSPVEGEFLRIVPDLVVELLSPSTASRDRGEKKAIYERNGVREYWIVERIACRVTRLVLDGDRFDLGTVLEDDAVLESTVLPGFRMTVKALLGE
jgi:Uma2 family endonuclease